MASADGTGCSGGDPWATAATQTRHNRTITDDFHDEATYVQRLDDGQAFVELVIAFLLALGFNSHKATCPGGGGLTRHSHDVHIRLRGVTIWRRQCTTCKAVFTVLPHFVLRSHQMRPEVARNALLATHGGHSSTPLLYRARQCKGLRVCALGLRLRHFVEAATTKVGAANGKRVRHWFQEKKAGWYAVLAASQMPVTSMLLDQTHNAIERQFSRCKGFHHPGGSQQAFLQGLAHLDNLVPYHRRATHARQGVVAVEGGRVPTADWMLNLHILTSGGFR
jgi:hypothetical protein